MEWTKWAEGSSGALYLAAREPVAQLMDPVGVHVQHTVVDQRKSQKLKSCLLNNGNKNEAFDIV